MYISDLSVLLHTFSFSLQRHLKQLHTVSDSQCYLLTVENRRKPSEVKPAWNFIWRWQFWWSTRSCVVVISPIFSWYVVLQHFLKFLYFSFTFLFLVWVDELFKFLRNTVSSSKQRWKADVCEEHDVSQNAEKNTNRLCLSRQWEMQQRS